MPIRQTIHNQREAILRLAQQHGATNIRLFGSVARGEDNTDSNIDFLVQFPNSYRLKQHLNLIVDLETLLGQQVDVVVEANLREEYRPYILLEAVPL